jgi:lysyl endopeptidase
MRKLITAIPFAILSLSAAATEHDGLAARRENPENAVTSSVMSTESEVYYAPIDKSALPAERFVGFTPAHLVTRVNMIAPSVDDVKQAKIDNARNEKRGIAAGAERETQPQSQERAQQIGLPAFMSESASRGLAPGALTWLPDGLGGAVARFDVTSAEAKAIRLGFNVGHVPRGAMLRFVGNAENNRVFAVSGADIASTEDGEYWSPIVMGDTISVEIQLRSLRDRGALELEVFGASHLFANPAQNDNDLFKAISKAGSQSCEVNIACSSDSAAKAVAAAVMRLVFTKSGSSFLCTGTLLNDTDTTTTRPYIYSANHCISTSTVANTLQTFWNYQSTTCGGTTSGPSTTLAGGAFLRVTDFNSDITLMEMKQPPPSGALFAGWNAGTVANNTSIVGIHHPAGDIKKISLGTMTNNNAPGFDGKTGTYYQVVWSSGVTEGGSSGSAIFTKSATSGRYQLRGGLLGGSSFCNAQSSPDIYSRMDLKFNLLQPYLAP